MPATSPRFTITVNRETDAALKRLAAVQGRPVASIIREFLDGVTPVLDDIADAMIAVRDAEASARAELVGSLEEVHAEMKPHFEGILGHFQALAKLGADEPTEASQAHSASVERSAPVTPPEGQPPLCNTGVVND